MHGRMQYARSWRRRWRSHYSPTFIAVVFPSFLLITHAALVAGVRHSAVFTCVGVEEGGFVYMGVHSNTMDIIITSPDHPFYLRSKG